MSTVWKDTDGFSKQYRPDFSIYLMTVLSSSYCVIIDCKIIEPGHEKNVINGLNATDKHYLKGKMELMGKFSQ